jgi:hypothetical protein
MMRIVVQIKKIINEYSNSRCYLSPCDPTEAHITWNHFTTSREGIVVEVCAGLLLSLNSRIIVKPMTIIDTKVSNNNKIMINNEN